MPFTISHAAAVLPLARPLSRKGYRLPFSALVLGSFTPDLDFLLGLNTQRIGHSFIGLLVFCLPLGWLLYQGFQHFAKQPLAALLGDAAGQRLRRAVNLESQKPARVLAAVLVGASTHIVWDGFTHESGLVAQQFALLRYPLAYLDGYTLRLCAVLQHLSSVLGLAFVMRYALKGLQVPEPMRFAWLGLLLLAGGVFALFEASQWLSWASLQTLAVTTAVCGLQGFGLSALAYCLYWHWAKRRTARLRAKRNYIDTRKISPFDSSVSK